jgi:mono/diheme cytochrome c family protein
VKTSTSWALTIGAAVVVGYLLVGIVAGLNALYGGFSRSAWGPPATGPEGLRGYNFEGRSYTSNGERIYYAGINEQGQRIPFEGGPMWLYMHGGSCVSCHGEDGRGDVPVMMGTEIPPDIRYEHLIEEEHEEGGEEHPPYTDETIKRAITQGLNPAGEPLDYTMPRFRMSEADLNDLLEYLKALE